MTNAEFRALVGALNDAIRSVLGCPPGERAAELGRVGRLAAELEAAPRGGRLSPRDRLLADSALRRARELSHSQEPKP